MPLKEKLCGWWSNENGTFTTTYRQGKVTTERFSCRCTIEVIDAAKRVEKLDYPKPRTMRFHHAVFLLEHEMYSAGELSEAKERRDRIMCYKPSSGWTIRSEREYKKYKKIQLRNERLHP